MYAGGDSHMNGDMRHDGGHGGGGHAVGEELKKTGRYETMDEAKVFKIAVSYENGKLYLFSCQPETGQQSIA